MHYTFCDEHMELSYNALCNILDDFLNLMLDNKKDINNKSHVIDCMDDYLIEVSISGITESILIARYSEPCNNEHTITTIKSDLRDCMREGKEYKYTMYFESIFKRYIKSQDIRKSKYYKKIMDFLVKKIYIRGF